MAADPVKNPLKEPSQTLYLVDVSSFIFRAFFAIRSLTNKAGEPTNAIYGVASMLYRLLEEAKPEHLAIVFDSKEPSFRKKVYPEYKANRSAPPDLLLPQFDRIDELVQKLGMPNYRVSGVEADDIIATLTKRWCELDPKHRVVIVSGDKDLMALVDDCVIVWDTMNNLYYGSEQVREKFGVPPTLIRDMLALIGDSSDNIPGVPSIGPKTATTLLLEHGDLEGVLQAAKDGKIAGKKGEVLVTHEKDARLSAELATLREDIPVEITREVMQYRFQLKEELVTFLQAMDFHSLVAKWTKALDLKATNATQPSSLSAAPTAPGMSTTAGVFKAIQTEEDFRILLARLDGHPEFGVDLETTSLNPRAAEIVGIAIALDLSGGFYIPVGHLGLANSAEPQLPLARVLAGLKPFLENPLYKKIGQNLKYDWSVLREQGLKPDGIGADTMVAAYVLEPENRHNLTALAAQYLDYPVLTYEEVCGKGKDQLGFEQVDIKIATRYSAEDAWIALKLWATMKPKLHAEGLMEVFAHVDLPLVQVLCEMELEGVCIDEPWLAQLSKDFEKELKRIEERVRTFAGDGPLNLNSTQQLAVLLFEKLGLPPQTRTKTGYSTDASVLEAIAPLHEVPRLLLEYREINKLKGTYVDPLPLLKDPKTGRIHAGFHQTVAATGRLSSSDPNLQNIPIRTERGKLIRRAFIPRPGNVLISADYSQIELRLLAQMSGDVELTRSFKIDEDVHRRTASEIFGVKADAVDDRQRGIAKAINFGLMYGKTPFGLAQELGISRKEAAEIIEKYFTRYHGVKRYLDRQIVEAKEKGWTQTLMGRKRRLPDIRSSNQAIRQNAERMAMNTPIQGTAADLMKLAMVQVAEAIKKGGFKARLIIQVHDEVVIDCPKDEVKEVQALVARAMENAHVGSMTMDVPLRVNSASGANWMEL